MTDYDYWRDAVAGKHPEIHADHPAPGYYAFQAFQGAPAVPVAIWYDRASNGLLAKKGYESLFELVDPLSIWTWVANRPVTYEAYHECVRTHQWPTEKSKEFQRLLAVLNSKLAVPDDIDGGELEDLAVRFESARQKENQQHLQAKRVIDRKYHEVLERIKDTLKALKQREEA